MKKEEVLQKIQEIGTCADDNTRRGLLADFQSELEKDYDSHEEATTKNTAYEQQVKKLQEDNMKLFLKIGDPSEPNKQVLKEDPKPKPKFEDLFNEKGELK